MDSWSNLKVQLARHFSLITIACVYLIFLISTISPLSYKIVHDNVEIIENSKRISMSNVRVHKFNKSTPVLSGWVNITDSVAMFNYTVFVDGYERMGMEHIYRKSAISLSIDFCLLIGGQLVFNKAMAQFGNFTEKCNLWEGHRTFYLKDWVIDERTPLPPEVPGKFWRVDVKIKSRFDSDQLFAQYYCHVERRRRKGIA